MKNIITALSNSNLNNELKKEKEFNILLNDIIYQDGIFEAIKNNEKIDFLFLSELLLGEYEIKDLIKKIKSENIFIKIILILENKNNNQENYFYSIGVYKIFYNNEMEINEIINLLKKEKNYDQDIEIKKEIRRLKEELIEKDRIINSHFKSNKNNFLININKNKNKINIIKMFKKNIRIIKNKYIENKKENTNKDGKVISVAGTGGVGKSVVTINLANNLTSKHKKVLIIDFDVFNNSLHTILGVKKYPNIIRKKLIKNDLIRNQIIVKNLIIKINKNLDLISGINLLFDKKYKISNKKIKTIINELKNNYDYIIIDNSSECFFDYTKNIFLNSDLILFILESNISEIKKSKNLLNIYLEKWQINLNKINLIINKYNNNSINEKILKEIFNDFKILGKINLNINYNYLINSKNKIKNKNINEEYKLIINKI